VNAVMNLRNSQNAEKFSLPGDRLASHKSLLNRISKYHTKRKGKREAVAVLRTHTTYSK